MSPTPAPSGTSSTSSRRLLDEGFPGKVHDVVDVVDTDTPVATSTHVEGKAKGIVKVVGLVQAAVPDNIHSCNSVEFGQVTVQEHDHVEGNVENVDNIDGLVQGVNNPTVVLVRVVAGQGGHNVVDVVVSVFVLTISSMTSSTVYNMDHGVSGTSTGWLGIVGVIGALPSDVPHPIEPRGGTAGRAKASGSMIGVAGALPTLSMATRGMSGVPMKLPLNPKP